MSRPLRTWVEISSSAVRHNLRSIQSVVGPNVGIIPIVKANAYGHGVQEISSIISKQKYYALGVAYGQEALEVRANGYRGKVIVLSFWQIEELPELIKKNIELVVWNWESWKSVHRASLRLKKKAKVHVKIDTGTTRIGFVSADIQRIRQQAAREKAFTIVGLFSHFANAEESSTRRTKVQLKYFTTLDKNLMLGSRVERHIACTAAILRYPEARFGLVRLGIGLYGLWPSESIRRWSKANLPQVQLRPALQWKAQLAQIKRVPTGTFVGYGGTWQAKKPSTIAVIPVGYSDGYPRSLSNTSWVMIRGHLAPVVGRISMNLMMVDVTKIPKVKLADVVTLLGPGIEADALARMTKTLHYEVTTDINPTIPRIIV